MSDILVEPCSGSGGRIIWISVYYAHVAIAVHGKACTIVLRGSIPSLGMNTLVRID